MHTVFTDVAIDPEIHNYSEHNICIKQAQLDKEAFILDIGKQLCSWDLDFDSKETAFDRKKKSSRT